MEHACVVELRELPPLRCFLLQATPEVAATLGHALPAPLSATDAMLGLGPEEWLLLAEPGVPQGPASLVDISDRYHVLSLQGPGVGELLNEGCPLDLADSAFPPGSCTRTLFGKAEIILWRPYAGEWRVLVARSFAAYLVALLREALADMMPA
jgi:sarcosine oxidase subunit gamma